MFNSWRLVSHEQHAKNLQHLNGYISGPDRSVTPRDVGQSIALVQTEISELLIHGPKRMNTDLRDPLVLDRQIFGF